MRGLRIGVDIGGTKCLGVVIDAEHRVVAEQRRRTPPSATSVIDTVVEVVGALRVDMQGSMQGLATDDVLAVGIGAPGLVTRDGTLLAAPNLVGVERLPLAKLVGERLHVEVMADNDATCALIGEARAGSAQGIDDVVMITLGTGIGGGILAGGRVMHGANGFAGEFGHMTVDPAGPQCGCGRRGCWEQFASGSALGALARSAARAGQLDATLRLAGGDVDAIRGEHLQTVAREGDRDALVVVDSFARWVALGLANLTNALDPAAFVLSGGLAAGADVYLQPIERWLGQLLYAAELRPRPLVRFGTLGEHAGAIGAALLTAER